jgi:hypothetical protein
MRPHHKASACSRLFGGIASALGLELRPIGLRDADAANRWLVAVKRQVQTGELPSVIGKAVEKVEELLSYGGRDPTGW